MPKHRYPKRPDPRREILRVATRQRENDWLVRLRRGDGSTWSIDWDVALPALARHSA